jgi:hypothetical protein
MHIPISSYQKAEFLTRYDQHVNNSQNEILILMTNARKYLHLTTISSGSNNFYHGFPVSRKHKSSADMLLF